MGKAVSPYPIVGPRGRLQLNPALDRATVTGMHRLAFTLAPRLLVAVLPAAAALSVAGCFTTGGNTTPDAGGVIPDGGTVLPDGAGQLPVGDGGPCLVATSVPMSQAPGYVSVHQQLNACSSTQLTTFVSACVATTAMPDACNTFQTDTANKGCMGCLFPGTPGSATENSGGMLVDSTGTIIVAVNTPGCIALADPANGPACASAIEPLFQCEVAACGSADCRTATASIFQSCETTSEKGACDTYYMASQTSCTADYGDGGAAVTACATTAQVLDRICGTGM